jgi:sugar phosphate permease
MWFKPFMQSYLVVFIGYLTMYLIRKNFNIAWVSPELIFLCLRNNQAL